MKITGWRCPLITSATLALLGFVLSHFSKLLLISKDFLASFLKKFVHHTPAFVPETDNILIPKGIAVLEAAD
jgi:hypothetical protein